VSPVSPTLMDAAAAGRALSAAVKDPRAPLTVADAAAVSGLALRDAERGLQWLSAEYRGNLRVGESGDLVFLFPTGWNKPWETRDRMSRLFSTVGSAGLGALRFIVRAWVMVVLLAYVALFLAVVVGMMFASQNDRRDRRGGLLGGDLAIVVFRVLADALFWTFHPFSPFAVGYGGMGYGTTAFGRAPRRAKAKDETPFYEKVNRFFFGPTPPPSDPRSTERKILAELRAQKGRIGLADVMRVTGLPRHQADPMMARLMLDYDGDVEVSEEGGIYYRFESMRKTAAEGGAASQGPRPRAAWDEPQTLPPLTGNESGSNVLIGALNGFNLIMSLVALDMNLTLSKLPYLFGRVPITAFPYAGTPIVLGVVPLVFSIALFLLPLARGAAVPFEAKRLAKEKGRLAILRTVLSRVSGKMPVTDAALTDAWKRATGEAPDSKEVTKRVVELGGDAEIQEDTGEVRYRFVDLETEAAALEAEREQASDEEKKIGKIVFASDKLN
jgi:hypothetical protein